MPCVRATTARRILNGVQEQNQTVENFQDVETQSEHPLEHVVCRIPTSDDVLNQVVVSQLLECGLVFVGDFEKRHQLPKRTQTVIDCLDKANWIRILV